MKHVYTALAILCAAQLGAAATATLSLKDGSTLKGVFLAERIDCSAAFAKALPLDTAIVKSLSFAGTNGEAKVELSNGDRLTVTVSTLEFPVSSMLGELKIPIANIRSMRLSPAKPGSVSGGLIFHCTFDDEAAIRTPAVGPEGTICSREFVDGKINKAVRVPNGGSAGFFTLPAETLGKEGCREFCAKLEPRAEYFRDCDPRMVFIKSPAGWLTIEYSANNGGGKGGFFVRCFGHEAIKGGLCGTRYRFSDTVRDVTGWHHYAVSWTETAVNVFLDGNIPDGMHQCNNVRIDAEKFRLGPAVIGLPNSNTSPYNTEPNTPFVIDELKIWDHAKEIFDL